MRTSSTRAEDAIPTEGQARYDARTALRSAAEALYALPLPHFTAERSALVRAARDRGDRDLAARIGAMTKPTTSAWLVNVLARERRDDLQALLALAAETARAQADGDRAALRATRGKRRDLLTRIAATTADRAEQAGQRVGPGVLDEFQQTLQAALANQDAAAAVRSGMLVRALRADGLEPVDLAGATALDRTAPVSVDAERENDGDGEDRRHRDAQQRAERARGDAEDSRRAAEAAAERVREAQEVERERASEVADLDREIAQLRDRLQGARAARDDARRASEEARAAADAAAHAAAETAAAAEIAGRAVADG